MSRATLAVDMCRMMAALCRRQMPPNSVFLATTRTCSRRLSGDSGTPGKNRALARLLEKHWVGVLRATPRGSKATVSNRARVRGGDGLGGWVRVVGSPEKARAQRGPA